MRRISHSMLEYSLSCYMGKESSGSTQFDNLASKVAAQKYLKERDTNKDGSLSQDEVTFSEEAFAKLDTDKSGVLSADELKAGLSSYEGEIYNYLAKTDTRWAKISQLSSMLKKA